ncbi:Na+/H+ antiporter NhaA [Campylobacter lari]|uniref:Na+/H+ antiporter NhaA n=1 Tax=Campylobacter lari TaxID=201 RepID=UPI002152C3E6|nr:Na+/H+ antiporter NhaA [Campylobacter lari]MCR6538165.1 Na+/H+ antiporter NhaA [Campylobacter lari]
MKLKQFQNFLSLEILGGLLLLLATIFALLLKNSPYGQHYMDFLSVEMGVKVGTWELFKPSLLWINDGLIAIFFFAIGLELKKEFVQGEFKTLSNITLPLMAAMGGIVVPALIFCAINFNDAYVLKGWAIPTATDTAFALVILAMLKQRIPSSLKIFLVSLAIFDDVGAILIIAIFYTGELSTLAFFVAFCCIVGLFILNRLGNERKSFYYILGALLWLSVLKSGVHATLAGIITALFIPVNTKNNHGLLEEIEHGLKFWIAFIILPLFAFANAGVDLSKIEAHMLFSGVSVGIFLGLFVGKQLGVFGFAYMAIKLKLAKLPKDANFKQLYGVCILTGIGFTMSFFIDALAYEVSDIFNFVDNFAILLASLASGVFGYFYLRFVK